MKKIILSVVATGVLASGAAFATATQDTLQVMASVIAAAPSCTTITANIATFGGVLSGTMTPKATSFDVNATCTNTNPEPVQMAIMLNAGNNSANGGSYNWAMTDGASPTPHYLGYNLYTNPMGGPCPATPGGSLALWDSYQNPNHVGYAVIGANTTNASTITAANGCAYIGLEGETAPPTGVYNDGVIITSQY